MKPTRPLSLLALAAALLAGGCATEGTYPHVTYPATYSLQVGNTQVTSNYGPQSSNVTASQRVAVAPDVPLYYSIVSPVAVSAYVYQDNDDGTRTLVGQMQGQTFNSSITPATGALEFAFAVTNANSSGTLQFTLSDQPLPAAAPPPTAPPPALPPQ